MASSLAGRHYIVTGGASGIGHATVKRLLRASATVHNIDKSLTFPSDLANAENLHLYPGVDVSSREKIDATIEAIFKRSPAIHGLVNAAGVSSSENYDMAGDTWVIEQDEDFAKVMDINVTGTRNLTNELLRRTLTGRNASEEKLSVVNIGSISSFRGYPMMAAYCASKHAVLGLTRTWAVEYGPLGHRFNVIAPGAIATPAFRAYMAEDAAAAANKDVLDKIPTRRYGEPDEVAGPILFLLSDDASYVTGEMLTVGGGMR